MAEDQTTTCVMPKGRPCSPCKERAAIRQQIKELEAKYHTLGTPMNASHDPFIHKVPPEIASHILSLSLPTSADDQAIRDDEQWSIQEKQWAVPLKLGSVCRRWRQLAWATPNLWTTVYIGIKLSMTRPTAELLPSLLCEWLGRSGELPLTIYFFPDIFEEPSGNTWTGRDELDVATGLVIDILNLHSDRWRSLHLKANAETLRRLSRSTELRQLVSLDLAITTRGYPEFMTKPKLNLTHLTLIDFHLKSVNIHHANITHATLIGISIDEYFDFLRQAPSLEYYCAFMYPSSGIIAQEPICHSRLRLLHLSTADLENVLDLMKLPSLEEWTQRLAYLPVEAMLSFLKRSGCPLKVLNLDSVPQRSEELGRLLQALPSLQDLYICFSGVITFTAVMDDILNRIFHSAPGSDAPPESLLPNLRMLECGTTPYSAPSPFSWARIPQLYLQGHRDRRSLALKSPADHSDISDKTAFKLLELLDEGVDLQIPDTAEKGDFLENFRNWMALEVVSS